MKQVLDFFLAAVAFSALTKSVWSEKKQEVRHGLRAPYYIGKAIYYIAAGRKGGKPDEEAQLMDMSQYAWVHSALRDDRLVVSATPSKQSTGCFLMTIQMTQRTSTNPA